MMENEVIELRIKVVNVVYRENKSVERVSVSFDQAVKVRDLVSV